jgi:tetratricopeptide (TPR) repeat protein
MSEQRLTLLAVLIGRDERTHNEIVEKFERCARDNDEDATLSVRTLRRWLAGDVRTAPRPSQRRVARLFWGYSMFELLAPPPAGLAGISRTGELIIGHPIGASPRSDLAGSCISTDEPSGSTNTLERQVAMATRRAARFATFAEIDNVGPEAIAQIQDDVVHLANAYIHDPLAAIMGDLIEEQEIVFRLLEGKQKPTLSRDLYLLAGVVSGLIAKASQDLGRFQEAMTHARTLYVCADNADHHGLRAWARGLQSLIAYWAGRPHEALRYAQSGSEHAVTVTGSVAAWLPALEARAWALMGDRDEAGDALGRAADRRATHRPDDLDAIGGLLAFPPAKHSYYAAGTYVCLEGQKQQERAQSEALSALGLFEHGRSEDRSFSDEAGARAELALARVKAGHVDGAREALAPVLALEPERRIGGIVTSAARVHHALRGGRHAASPVIQSLREEIEGFCRVPAAALPA